MLTTRDALSALGEAMDQVAEDGKPREVTYRERIYRVRLTRPVDLASLPRFVWAEVASAPGYFFQRVAFSAGLVRRMNRWHAVEDVAWHGGGQLRGE